MYRDCAATVLLWARLFVRSGACVEREWAMIRATCLAAGLLLATPALAQTGGPAAPIVTSAPQTTTPPAPAPAAPATASNTDTAKQISAWINEDGDSSESRPVAGLVPAMPQRDRAIHGEVGASIGSGGYRSAYGVANMPIGQNSDVTVAISDEHFGAGNRRRGYGYGWGGGDRRSLGIALNLNSADRGGPGASRCDDPEPPKWSLGLPDDVAMTNGCRRRMADAPR